MKYRNGSKLIKMDVKAYHNKIFTKSKFCKKKAFKQYQTKKNLNFHKTN